MASLERTAYPRFKRLISERELREYFTPSAEETAWARERTHDRPGRVLALLVMLKSAARLGRVPKIGEIPEVVVAHVHDQAGLTAGTVPEADSERSEERHRSAVRERLELKHRPGEARAVAEAAMRDETVVMLSKRMSRHLKRAQEELLEIEKRRKETTEQLLATFRDVLDHVLAHQHLTRPLVADTHPTRKDENGELASGFHEVGCPTGGQENRECL